jgi:hypothetical protein
MRTGSIAAALFVSVPWGVLAQAPTLPVFHRAPYGIPSGWSTFEQAMSESIQSVR